MCGYFVGLDNECLEVFVEVFDRDDIDVIFCVCGGYGVM